MVFFDTNGTPHKRHPPYTAPPIYSKCESGLVRESGLVKRESDLAKRDLAKREPDLVARFSKV